MGVPLDLAEGAGSGFALGGPVGAGIGLGASAIASFFAGKSEDEERRKRFRDLLARLAAEEKAQLSEGVGKLSQEARDAVAFARQGAARRAVGSGQNIESAVVSASAPAEQAGSQGIKDFLFNTQSAFRTARIQAEGDYANRPIQPGLLDFASTLGEGYGRLALNEMLLPKVTEPTKTTEASLTTNTTTPPTIGDVFNTNPADPFNLVDKKKTPTTLGSMDFLSRLSFSPYRRPAFGLGN